MNFSDIREKIVTALQNPDRKFNIPEQVALYEGFVGAPFFNVISNQTQTEGVIPLVMLMGVSGQTYFVSLKVLLPELEFPVKEKDAQEK